MENTIKYIDFIECEKEHIMTFCKIAWGFDEKFGISEYLKVFSLALKNVLRRQRRKPLFSVVLAYEYSGIYSIFFKGTTEKVV